ncbi:MAG TPA: endonuclease domain-containing protein [Pseudolabrys sp.]|nr:endonuclease domain-containing protein [Pseudolabrys sp.]
MTSRARKLRGNLTDADQKLWRALRRDQLNGLHFRRQHPVGPYTLDFYCPQIRLAIELDGGQHNMQSQAEKDRRRSEQLGIKGIVVIRFWNNDVLSNIEGVLAEIVRISRSRSDVTPSPTLPFSGGGSQRDGRRSQRRRAT